MRMFAGAGFLALLFASMVHAQPEPADLKGIALDDAGDVYLSLGATLRVRQEVLSQPGLGLLGESHDDFTTLRALVHADLQATLCTRAFVELGSMWAFGRSLPQRSVDEDRLDVRSARVVGRDEHRGLDRGH